MDNQNIAIIGGGPASFMAAIVAAENSCGKTNTDIIEKNIPLKTILYTGNGRCNFSNEIYDYKELASNYPRGEKFLYSIFNRFGVAETLDWFDLHGVEYYVQEDKRIFPKTNKASTIRDMFLQKARTHSINILSGVSVEKIEKTDKKFILNMGKSQKEYDKVIIATGGSIRGFENSGYKLAKELGHSLIDLKPSLTAFIAKENYFPQVAGVSIKNAEISILFQNKQLKKLKGDFVYTHKGLSGPLIFKASAYCAYLNYSKTNPLLLKINFLPDIDIQKLEKELLKEFDSNPLKSLDNILKQYLPKSLIKVLLEQNKIDAEKKSNQITKEERKKIIKILTETEITVISTEPEGEIVTAGGINLKEINPKTMESKLVEGLYFCGEILDVDGFTGGFNLQACWSTGFIAGVSLSAN